MDYVLRGSLSSNSYFNATEMTKGKYCPHPVWRKKLKRLVGFLLSLSFAASCPLMMESGSVNYTIVRTSWHWDVFQWVTCFPYYSLCVGVCCTYVRADFRKAIFPFSSCPESWTAENCQLSPFGAVAHHQNYIQLACLHLASPFLVTVMMLMATQDALKLQR